MRPQTCQALRARYTRVRTPQDRGQVQPPVPVLAGAVASTGLVGVSPKHRTKPLAAPWEKEGNKPRVTGRSHFAEHRAAQTAPGRGRVEGPRLLPRHCSLSVVQPLLPAPSAGNRAMPCGTAGGAEDEPGAVQRWAQGSTRGLPT